MQIEHMGIDTGYEGNQVYNFVRQHRSGSRVVAVDGRSNGELLAMPSLVDVTSKGPENQERLQALGRERLQVQVGTIQPIEP
jgi:phage terminase large subunit GpA-like protein